MSSRELIESLRCAGEEKIRAIRQEAEQETETVRTDAARKIEELRKKYAGRLAAAADAETGKALADAEKQLRKLRLSTEQVIAERLLAVARSALQELRDEHYPAVFEKLALELPVLGWKLVRVNPLDVKLARTYFPEAEIVPLETIAGGMDAALADGSLRVVNTFEKRLERSWSELLPLLLRNVSKEASDGAAAPESR